MSRGKIFLLITEEVVTAVYIEVYQGFLPGFFGKASSFEAREAYQYLNNRLGIFHARDGG